MRERGEREEEKQREQEQEDPTINHSIHSIYMSEGVSRVK